MVAVAVDPLSWHISFRGGGGGGEWLARPKSVQRNVTTAGDGRPPPFPFSLPWRGLDFLGSGLCEEGLTKSA